MSPERSVPAHDVPMRAIHWVRIFAHARHTYACPADTLPPGNPMLLYRQIHASPRRMFVCNGICFAPFFFNLFCANNWSGFCRVFVCNVIPSRFYGFVIMIYLFCSMFFTFIHCLLVIFLGRTLFLFLLLSVLTISLVFFFNLLSFIHKSSLCNKSFLFVDIDILIYNESFARTLCLFFFLYQSLTYFFLLCLFSNFPFAFFHY